MTKQTILVGVAGLVLGAAAVLGIRFATYNPPHVHYHANFDVYINGAREPFKSPFYYQEIAGGSCTAGDNITPAERVHMHDNVSDLVHVHDHAVTWGAFFQNLGWTVNDRIIQTPDNLYVADTAHPITFLVNGRAVQNISTEVINDRDRLLVDYGTTSNTTLQKEAKAIPTTATKYDVGKDPAACQSNAKPTVQQRLKHLL